jgi:L-asparaginase II
MPSASSRSGLDLPKLAKVLAQLDGPNDHVVLEAARRAAAMLREAGTDWSALLGSDVASDPKAIAEAQTIHHRTKGALHPPVGATWGQTLRFLCSTPGNHAGLVPGWMTRTLPLLEAQRPTERPDLAPIDAYAAIELYSIVCGQQATGR